MDKGGRGPLGPTGQGEAILRVEQCGPDTCLAHFADDTKVLHKSIRSQSNGPFRLCRTFSATVLPIEGTAGTAIANRIRVLDSACTTGNGTT